EESDPDAEGEWEEVEVVHPEDVKKGETAEEEEEEEGSDSSETSDSSSSGGEESAPEEEEKEAEQDEEQDEAEGMDELPSLSQIIQLLAGQEDSKNRRMLIDIATMVLVE
ncbi:hypothetical protein KIPB_011953, partial [Kipferlia bialata]